ncbi:hypothetical protein CIP106467_4857 [Citrobacter europaeus]|nr:hypothetical protein CIP106467_4857 [Citrobacter europaeus]
MELYHFSTRRYHQQALATIKNNIIMALWIISYVLPFAWGEM